MKSYTLLFVPHKSGKRPIELNIGKFAIAFFSLFVLLLFVVFGSTLYLSTKVGNITLKYYQLESRNKSVLQKLEDFNEKTEELKSVVFNLKEKDQEIRRLLGVNPNNKYFPRKLKKN